MLIAGFSLSQPSLHAADTIYFRLSDMGIRPNTAESITGPLRMAIEKIKRSTGKGKLVVISFAPGRYEFYPDTNAQKTLYISNHDQTNPKSLGLHFQNMQEVLVDGNGAELIFHGRMLPIAMEQVAQFTLKNLHIDFENPQICQVEVLQNDTTRKTITFRTAPWVQYEIRDSSFSNKGQGWKLHPRSAIAFDQQTRHIVYQTSDIAAPLNATVELEPGVIKAFNWYNPRLQPGTILALRSGQRPAPAIFVDQSNNIRLLGVKVHYAEGMGLLAQVSENITLDRFEVALRGPDDPRYFTTQADATHFSGCRGLIRSVNGRYEAMMDDAINVHGTYLKVRNYKDAYTLVALYMHGQSYGFKWGDPGDEIQFIASKTMETVGERNRIRSIRAVDQPNFRGAKLFEISFQKKLDTALLFQLETGIENLSWTPEVYFANNVIRNNRARGALFSTPKSTIIENNLFDHTSGSAILLCGDCNGWFETGACHSVMIRNNRFVNALTNMFQFTNAIISIAPVIPDLKNQHKYFHSGITITSNSFETFDRPLVYAKSVQGLEITHNKITTTRDYPAFHWNKHPFLFERVTNYKVEDNSFDYDFDPERDIQSD
ncbi:alpha-1,3-galactosidase [Niabella terrae]